jgi:hypothetical protein
MSWAGQWHGWGMPSAVVQGTPPTAAVPGSMWAVGGSPMVTMLPATGPAGVEVSHAGYGAPFGAFVRGGGGGYPWSAAHYQAGYGAMTQRSVGKGPPILLMLGLLVAGAVGALVLRRVYKIVKKAAK